MNLAIKHDFSMIRILQVDVYDDRTNWKKFLIKYIKKYDKSTILCKGNIYKCFGNLGEIKIL